jgi:2-methylcitrate dehydratase PrpD
MQSGFAAQAGVLSALLAERGVTGVKDVLEGKFGFFALYKRNRYDRAALLAGLGHRFGSDALSLKPYPCCRGNHGAIEAALDLRASGIDAEAISGVRVMLPPVALDLVGRDFDPGDNPVVAAQFSAQFTVATAFVHGRVGVEAFRAAAIADPRVGALLRRVSVVRGEDTGDAFGPASVEVRTSDGQVHRRTVEVLRGHPDRPLTDDEVMEKFTICAGLAPTPLAKQGVVALAEAVAALEGVGDVSDLTRELRGG